MSEGPRRLFDGGDDDFSALLRGALEAERSDDVDRARLERIGRGVASAIGGGVASAPVHAALAPKSPVVPATKASWLASKAPFMLVAAASVSGIAAGVLRREPARTVESREAPRLETPAPTPTAKAPSPETATASPEPPTMSPADLPSAPVAMAAPPPAPVRVAKSAASSDVGEIALLARAHDALHTEPVRSLALCKEHAQLFPDGHFAQEREAVAIEALVYLGRRDEAARRWSAFRERYPSSSHRVHLESLLAAPAQ